MTAMEKNRLRRRYALIFLLLLAVEVCIALFVHDRFAPMWGTCWWWS